MYPASKWRMLSGHSMMIRACRSFKIPRSQGRVCNIRFSGAPLGCSFRLLLSSADLGRTLSNLRRSWRWESGKRFLLSKRSVLSTAIKRPLVAAAADVDSLCRWTTPPRRCAPVCWRWPPRLCCWASYSLGQRMNPILSALKERRLRVPANCSAQRNGRD
jgi:hypothetical protein